MKVSHKSCPEERPSCCEKIRGVCAQPGSRESVHERPTRVWARPKSVWQECPKRAILSPLGHKGETAHRWLWSVLQKRYARVLRIWWKNLKRRYSSNKIFFGRTLPNVKLRGFSQNWIFNMRVSERLRSLVFIQIHFFQKNQQLSSRNFSSQVFIYKYNFGYGNLKCSRHRPLNLSKGFHSPDLAALTSWRFILLKKLCGGTGSHFIPANVFSRPMQQVKQDIVSKWPILNHLKKICSSLPKHGKQNLGPKVFIA